MNSSLIDLLCRLFRYCPEDKRNTYKPYEDPIVQDTVELMRRVDNLRDGYVRDDTDNAIWSLLADRPKPPSLHQRPR